MNENAVPTITTPTGLVLRKPVLPTILIDLGSRAAIEKPAADALELAAAMVIDSPEMASQAAEEIAAWAKQDAEIEAWRCEFTVPLDNAKKSVMDFVRKARTDLAGAQSTLRGKVAGYVRAEQERVARERREAEDHARREREKAEADAREKERLAREERQRAEALAAEAANQEDPEKKKQLEAEASAAAQASEHHLDEAATSAAIATVITPAAVQEVAKIGGLRSGQKVELEVTDMLPFLTWIVANPAFVHLVTPDTAALKALEKSMKDKFNIPGVKVTRDVSVARGARAA
jgi:colicin import membrane protein